MSSSISWEIIERKDEDGKLISRVYWPRDSLSPYGLMATPHLEGGLARHYCPTRAIWEEDRIIDRIMKMGLERVLYMFEHPKRCLPEIKTHFLRERARQLGLLNDEVRKLLSRWSSEYR